MSNIATKSAFTAGIHSYDIHTYWSKSIPNQREQAYALRERVQKEFAADIENGDLRVFKFWEEAIGPHPLPMWECDFKKPEILSKILPWFQIHHDGLSVLIHPRSEEGEVQDHTENALWLGTKQELLVEFLKGE